MATAALVAWVVTAGIGAYMLRTWLVRGGLRRADHLHARRARRHQRAIR